MHILRTRPEFLRCASAIRRGAGSFLLQARFRDDQNLHMQVGFTATKKIGNAVARNRAKRRMRALAREIIPHHGRPGWDYVIVARPNATLERSFDGLRGDLKTALENVHKTPPKAKQL